MEFRQHLIRPALMSFANSIESSFKAVLRDGVESKKFQRKSIISSRRLLEHFCNFEHFINGVISDGQMSSNFPNHSASVTNSSASINSALELYRRTNEWKVVTDTTLHHWLSHAATLISLHALHFTLLLWTWDCREVASHRVLKLHR